MGCQLATENTIETCDQIDYSLMTVDFDSGNDFLDARCTEIGYYYGLMCKLNADKCEATTVCGELDMYATNSVDFKDSLDMCTGFEGCVKDTDKCKKFAAADDFKFDELN